MLQLGEQLDQISARTLQERLIELASENQRLNTELQQAMTGNDRLQRQARQLEDDLTAARTSLRRMMKRENL